jgi:hypothetical protein
MDILPVLPTKLTRRLRQIEESNLCLVLEMDLNAVAILKLEGGEGIEPSFPVPQTSVLAVELTPNLKPG